MLRDTELALFHLNWFLNDGGLRNLKWWGIGCFFNTILVGITHVMGFSSGVCTIYFFLHMSVFLKLGRTCLALLQCGTSEEMWFTYILAGVYQAGIANTS